MTALSGLLHDVRIRRTENDDLPAISDLHAAAFGPGRFARTAYRAREGTPDISQHCHVALSDDAIIAAVRYTPIAIGTCRDALLLGPLAVAPRYVNLGVGRKLVAESLDVARDAGIRYVLLVGDLAYYGRLGFERLRNGQIMMPGPVDPARLLGRHLVELGAAAPPNPDGPVTTLR